MKVKVINKSKHGLPQYKTEGSAGMDVHANLETTETLAPFQRKLIPTGLYAQIPHGYELQVRPRSGLALKKGVTVANSPGTIDSDYRGEIKVILINLSNDHVDIENGDRIAQFVIAKHSWIEWNQVDELDDTDRGDGGFGHTGNK